MKYLIYILFILPVLSFSQENIKYSNTININDLYDHIEILASDSLEGRETGKPGQKMAAEYIANHFKSIGIPPYKENTYYQKFKGYFDKIAESFINGDRQRNLEIEDLL